MEKNAIINVLEKIVGTDKIEFISGEILDVGTKECRLSDERGSVYGIAIKIDDLHDKKNIFDSIDPKYRKIKDIDDWKAIEGNYFPLYWGKDVNMGIRLYSHTKSMKSTGTLQLNISNEAMKNHEIIYGALPCVNYKNSEDKLHDRYADLMKTRKKSKY